jgi:hypothetical protein
MAKPIRSPLHGYNHNVKYKGRVYHVQTEDSGPGNPHLFTHLYYEGIILATKRYAYDRDSPDAMVRGLMQGQHKAILKELRHGTHDGPLGGFFRTRGEAVAIGELAASEEGTTSASAPVTPEIPDILATEAAAPLPESIAFDLDAMPAGLDSLGPELTPSPLPAAGPGVYTLRSGGMRPPRPSEPLMPLVIFDAEPTEPNRPIPTWPASNPRPSRAPGPPPGQPPMPSRPAPEANTLPPGPRPFGAPPSGAPAPARPSAPGMPGSTPPVRPPVHAGVAVPVRPATPSGAPRTSVPTPNPTAVVVQRQVGVGAPTVARPAVTVPRRRPAPSVPYVVKEGTHAQTPPPQRSASPLAPAGATPPPLPSDDLVSDQSLDEVILAYLSQGDTQD